MLFSKFSLLILGISALSLAACSPASDPATEQTSVPAADMQQSQDHEHADGDSHSDGHESHDHGDHAEGAVDTSAADAHAGEMVASEYPLTKCPITGATLGEMGDPIVEIIEGREVQFCCKACPDKFKANSALYFQKMDNEIIALQGPDYPLDFCMVSGDKLGEDGEIVETVISNQLFRTCCNDCVKEIKADPAKYLAILADARAGKDVSKPEGSDSKGDDHSGH